MERWIQMHYQIRERELALQISKSRELFFWLGAFYAVSMVGMVYRFVLGATFATYWCSNNSLVPLQIQINETLQ